MTLLIFIQLIEQNKIIRGDNFVFISQQETAIIKLIFFLLMQRLLFHVATDG